VVWRMGVVGVAIVLVNSGRFREGFGGMGEGDAV